MLGYFDRRPIQNRPLEETNLLCLAKFEFIGLPLYAYCCTVVCSTQPQQQYATYG